MKVIIFTSLLLLTSSFAGAQRITWPEGKQLAISLSFDDGRVSQVKGGTALLDKYGVKATFYVLPSAVESNLNGWKSAVANGHEVGNHSMQHPCSGNFLWARDKALEMYSLEQMHKKLLEANRQIERLLGVTPTSFAYPCGQTFVGKGTGTKSYVPVVAGTFATGRLWLSEAPNDPLFCDFAQLTGIESDGKDFEAILPIIEQAQKNNQWIVFAGHEIAESGSQTTRLSMLEELLKYAADSRNGIWIAPVATVATYVESQRKNTK